MRRNPNIRWEHIMAHAEMNKLSSYSLSMNPNVTWKIVKEDLNIIFIWNDLSMNPNMLIMEDEIVKAVRTRLIWSRFKRIWRRCNSDPNHAFCKNRLMREFGDGV